MLVSKLRLERDEGMGSVTSLRPLSSPHLGFPTTVLNAPELLSPRPYDWESAGGWGMGRLVTV